MRSFAAAKSVKPIGYIEFGTQELTKKKSEKPPAEGRGRNEATEPEKLSTDYRITQI